MDEPTAPPPIPPGNNDERGPANLWKFHSISVNFIFHNYHCSGGGGGSGGREDDGGWGECGGIHGEGVRAKQLRRLRETPAQGCNIR